MSQGVENAKSLLWAALILFFSWQMLIIIWPYTSWEWDVYFLQSKYLIIHLDYYRCAFYSHIFSSLIVLFCGAFLFSAYALKNYPKFHRHLGKIYVGLLLLISAPSGMVMAFHANGGWLAKLSFLILTPLWWWFTYRGYTTARQGLFAQHRRWMFRSYALTLSAITLRFGQMVLSYTAHLDPTSQYILVSWTSWIFNLILIEIWIRYRDIKYILSNTFWVLFKHQSKRLK